MNLLDSNKGLKLSGFKCFVKHSKWYFLINAHMRDVFLAFLSRMLTSTSGLPAVCYIIMESF